MLERPELTDLFIKHTIGVTTLFLGCFIVACKFGKENCMHSLWVVTIHIRLCVPDSMCVQKLIGVCTSYRLHLLLSSSYHMSNSSSHFWIQYITKPIQPLSLIGAHLMALEQSNQLRGH